MHPRILRVLCGDGLEIPFFDMASELAVVRPDIERAITRVLDSGTFVGGPEVSTFERELAEALHVPHAVGTSSGTDALLAILMALGIGPGDEVVTTPFTFFATAGAAARLGARVVFADIDADSLTLDANAAATACSDRTRAVVPVHLFGHPAAHLDVPVPVIEDAAQAVGGPPPRGVAAALSFFPTKILGALGDAGAVLTADPSLADRITRIRSHGAHPKYEHGLVGGNFRLDAIQAAILRAKLPNLSGWIQTRRDLAHRYIECMRGANLPAEVRPPADHADHVWNQFVIRVPRRDALQRYLSDRGVGTEVYYPKPLHLQAGFESLGYGPGSFPNAEAACLEVLALPLYPSLPPSAPASIVRRLTDFYRNT